MVEGAGDGVHDIFTLTFERTIIAIILVSYIILVNMTFTLKVLFSNCSYERTFVNNSCPQLPDLIDHSKLLGILGITHHW